MKRLIKFIIPTTVLNLLMRKRVINNFKRYVDYDINLYVKHSGLLFQDTQTKAISKIILNYHIIEKGLTMPDMKPGFGKDRMMLLIDECLNFKDDYDSNNPQFLHALGVIAEYKRVHKACNFKIDKELLYRIDLLLKEIKNIPFIQQIDTNREVYFSDQNAPFDKFSASRCSVRNFEGIIESKQIQKAVELAQNSPSACNRQPTRIHVLENKELIQKTLKIQNGNRGFGHLADKIIITTVDLSVYQTAEERNLAYIDGGMYAMNLLYALHFNNVATCTLNWCTSPADDLKLREIISIPESEIVILLIACGDVPAKFKLANSKRNNHQDIIKIH